MDSPNSEYGITLSVAQWDLVVLALGNMLERAAPPNQGSSVLQIDQFCRRVLRRRLNEIIATIQGEVPEAGCGELDP